MVAGVQQPLWQQMVDRRLEHILLCWARFDEAMRDFARFQDILKVQLLPADINGVIELFWPAIHPELIVEIKNTSRLWSIAGKSVSWLEGVPVFQPFGLKAFLCFSHLTVVMILKLCSRVTRFFSIWPGVCGQRMATDKLLE